MLEKLKNKPSIKINRIILIAGLLVFIPCYTTIVQVFGDMGIVPKEFNAVWLSFDVETFTNFFKRLDQAGQLQTFFWSYQINIISMTGFMLTFFALALMGSRSIPAESRLFKTAYYFPVLAIIISLADIIPSLLVLSASGDPMQIAAWITWTISACYYFRVILLYALLIWMLTVGIAAVYRKYHTPK